MRSLVALVSCRHVMGVLYSNVSTSLPVGRHFLNGNSHSPDSESSRESNTDCWVFSLVTSMSHVTMLLCLIHRTARPKEMHTACNGRRRIPNSFTQHPQQSSSGILVLKSDNPPKKMNAVWKNVMDPDGYPVIQIFVEN